ncbi:MAG: head-tail adaptor protein [Sphingomonadaceae bacterium]|nr:head-tail adaptor protein [Sphingomonadaceae bacterium]
MPPRTPTPGDLREIVTLEQPPSLDDGAGGRTGTWQRVARLPAMVEAEQGSLAVEGSLATGATRFRVTIRPRALGTGWRLGWTDTVGQSWRLIVRAQLPMGQRPLFLQLICEGTLLADGEPGNG